MRLSNRVVLASNDRHLLNDFSEICSSHPEIHLVPPHEFIRNREALDFLGQQAVGLENAVMRGRQIQKCCHYPVLAENLVLEGKVFESLPGLVGTHGVSHAQVPTSHVRDLLKHLTESADRQVKLVCYLVLAMEGLLLHVEKSVQGMLTSNPGSEGGTEYDSLFIPQGQTKTLSEMSVQEKKHHSPRRMAVESLIAQCKSHGILFAKP